MSVLLLKSNKQIKILLALVIAGFLFRLLLIKFRFVPAFDEINYLKLGISGGMNGLGEIFHPYWTPLLPGLISITSMIFDDYIFAGRLVTIIAGSFVVIPVYMLAKDMFNETIGFVAACFICFYPPIAYQSTQVLTEPVTMLMATFAIYYGMKLLEHYSLRYAILAGVLTGLLYLNHPKSLGFFCVIVTWIVLKIAFKTRLKKLVIGVSFVLAFIVVALPYVLYLKMETGVWTISSKAAANLQFESSTGDHDTDPFRTLDDQNQSIAIDQIYHVGNFLTINKNSLNKGSGLKIGSFLIKYFRNLYSMLKRSIPQLFTTLPMLLLGIGLLGVSWEKFQGWKIIYLLSFIIFFWFLLIPSFHIIERYLSPLFPICAIWIANGGVTVYRKLCEYEPLNKLAVITNKDVKLLAGSSLMATVLVFSFFPEMGKILSKDPYCQDYWTPPIEQKIAGEWLNTNMPGKKVIMSFYHSIDIYVNNFEIKESVTIPDHEIDRVVAYAKNRGVNYIVLNERYLYDMPRLKSLFESTEQIPGLERIYNEVDATGYKTIIFKVQIEKSGFINHLKTSREI